MKRSNNQSRAKPQQVQTIIIRSWCHLLFVAKWRNIFRVGGATVKITSTKDKSTKTVCCNAENLQAAKPPRMHSRSINRLQRTPPDSLNGSKAGLLQNGTF